MSRDRFPSYSEEETELSRSLDAASQDEPLGFTVLYHPNVERVGEICELPQLDRGQTVSLSRLKPLFHQPGVAAEAPLADRRLSRQPLTLAPEKEGSIRLCCHDSPTVVVADGRAVHGEQTFSTAELARGVVLLLGNRVVLLLHSPSPVFDRALPRFAMVGDSTAIADLRREIQRVSRLDAPILLRGPTGSGKELVARAIHQAGPRRTSPFLIINMGAIPPSLAAAELFGAEAGAFTGADRRREGYFQRAHGGTLFLDEIGEIPSVAQPLLLRALENLEIQPVGSAKPTKVDVRLLNATDLDLEKAVETGKLRAPLLHRLTGYELEVPSLWERRDDIGRLLFHFLAQELVSCRGNAKLLTDPGSHSQPWFPAKLAAALAGYSWPGNVRQLHNIVRRLVISCHESPRAQLDSRLRRLLEQPAEANTADPARSPKEISEEELVSTLRAHRWHPGASARELGISRASLYLLIDRCPRTRKASDLSRGQLEEAHKRCHGKLEAMVDELEVSIGGLKRRMKHFGLG